MLAADAPWWMGEFGNLPHNPGDRRPDYQGGKATGANASNFGQPQRSPFAAYGQPQSQGSQNGPSPLTRAPRTASPYLPPPTTGGPMPAFDQSRTQTATPYSAYAPRPNSAYQAPNPFGQAYGGTFVPGGGQGNLAYAAPSDRPPPFTQATTFGGQQFGDMGQSLAMRDAFIQSLNQSRAGHAQQWGMGNTAPPPSNFDDLMQQAGQMAQGGWANPFNPGQAQPVQPPSQGTQYGSPGYGTPPDRRGGPRTAVFRDRDGDGVDDRDQDGPGMPRYGRPQAYPGLGPQLSARPTRGRRIDSGFEPFDPRDRRPPASFSRGMARGLGLPREAHGPAA